MFQSLEQLDKERAIALVGVELKTANNYFSVDLVGCIHFTFMYIVTHVFIVANYVALVCKAMLKVKQIKSFSTHTQYLATIP